MLDGRNFCFPGVVTQRLKLHQKINIPVLAVSESPCKRSCIDRSPKLVILRTNRLSITQVVLLNVPWTAIELL